MFVVVDCAALFVGGISLQLINKLRLKHSGPLSGRMFVHHLLLATGAGDNKPRRGVLMSRMGKHARLPSAATSSTELSMDSAFDTAKNKQHV